MTDTPCSFYNIHGYSWKMRKISIPPCALGFTEAGLLLQERRDFQRSDCSSCRCLLLRFFRQKFGIFFSFGFGIWFQCRSWCTHKIALAFFRSSVLCSFFAHKTSTALLRNKKHKCKARTGRTGGRYKNLEWPVVIKVNLMDEFIDYKVKNVSIYLSFFESYIEWLQSSMSWFSMHV